MSKKTIKKKSKGTPIVIKDSGSDRLIGYYKEETKTFECTREKDKHFMRKNQSWGLDKKVVDYLVPQNATVLLIDKESKWKYSAKAKDFKTYGSLLEFHEHGEQYFLPVDRWQVIRANNRSYVVSCQNKLCRFNFASNCILGGLRISEDGGCLNYECK